MSTSDLAAIDHWNNRAQDALQRYSEPLLRQVMQQLLKPRNQWPVDELIDRGLKALTNAAVIDRRLNELSPACRKLLTVIGLSGLPSWRVGHLIAILATLEHSEGLTPVLTLLNEGLVHPELPAGINSLKQFEDWLGPTGIASARLFAHPAITSRALNGDLGLPALPSRTVSAKVIRQSDGLEWLLRTAVAWSRVAADPLRLTQQQTLFKRDLQKFQADELLNSPFAEQLTELPDPGLLALELAVAAGLIEARDGELRPRPAPHLWKKKLAPALVDLWRALIAVEAWCPLEGYAPPEEGSLFPSVLLPAFLALRSLPHGEWAQAESVAEHLFPRHPSWSARLKKKPELGTQWIERLYLGIGYHLRLVEAVREPSGWWFRLGDIGRHVLLGDKLPNLHHEFSQMLIVQPNGEMVIFRQGLTPELIGLLSRFALWKTIGAACTMELTAESVYRGLETGLLLADVQRLLEQHGTRAVPANMLDALQRWSSKRERITVWASATLLEFTSSDDLDAAFTRGLVSIKLTDRIGIASGGEELDYRPFRLIGNRDYEARTQKCLTFAPDGVTFTIDTAQSDLILEAELTQLAVPVAGPSTGPRRFRLTPESLRQAQQRGYGLAELEQWALNRSGEPLSNSARLLFPGSGVIATWQRRLVIQLPTETIADGLMQWPATGSLVEERLGPCALVVAEENLPALIEQLGSVGVTLQKAEGE
jgi:hypothetical protein